MGEKFKREKKKYVFSSYKAKDSLREEEFAAYRRIALVVLILMGFAAAVYLWGIEFVIAIGSFWSRLNLTTKITPVSPSPIQTLILAPQINPLPTVTNKESDFTISGTAQPGMDIEIFINGERIDTTFTSSDGSFEIVTALSKEGKNEIYAQARSDKMESKKSNIQMVILDKTPPELELTSPQPAQEIKQESNKFTVTGKTEREAIVTVNGHRAIVNLEGEFSYELTLQEGENTIKVEALDPAGNKTSVERTVTFPPQ